MTKVEEVARAICTEMSRQMKTDTRPEKAGVCYCKIEEMAELCPETMRFARAAIKAMREPTPEMVAAIRGLDQERPKTYWDYSTSPPRLGFHILSPRADEFYRTAIDAALSEDKG